MMGRSFVNPKYENNFNENRKLWLDAALKYSEKDPDFIGADAIYEICALSKTKANSFRYAYRTKVGDQKYNNSVSLFLIDSVKRELDYLNLLLKESFPIKDDFDRDDLIIKILRHVSEESSLYLIDLRRKKIELLFNLIIILSAVYKIGGKNFRHNHHHGFDRFSASPQDVAVYNILLNWYADGLSEDMINTTARSIDKILSK